MSALGQGHAMMFAVKVVPYDAADLVVGALSGTDAMLEADLKRIITGADDGVGTDFTNFTATRFMGILESTGGGKSTASATTKAWGPDKDPQPLPGETTLNDFTCSGYYDVGVDAAKSTTDDKLLDARHGDEWAFVSILRDDTWDANIYFCILRRGLINNTDEINVGDPLSFTVGAQQKGKTARVKVTLS